MAQKFANNARALLVAGISDTDTSIVIQAAKADLFPVANVGTGTLPSTNSWFKVTLQNSAGAVEIVAVRTRTAGSGVLTNVIRGYDDTTPLNFVAGTVVGLRITAEDVQTALDLPNQNNTFTGNNTFSNNVTLNGGATGNVTGNLTGNVTGNVTGNAGTVTNGVYTTGNQTIAGTKTFSSTIAGSISGNAATASAASVADFGTAVGTTAVLRVNATGQAAAYLYSQPSSWGLYSDAGGSMLDYNRSTGAKNFYGNASTVTTVTTTQVLNAIASAQAGDVGSYAFLSYVVNTPVAVGTLIAGSSLRYRGATSTSATSGNYFDAYGSSAPVGTWRLMGYIEGYYEYYGLNGNHVNVSSLWLRVS